MDEILALTASGLTSAAVLASLVRRLVDLGILSQVDVQAIYEDALLMLETQQGESPASQQAFVLARELIEQHLRPKSEP